MSLLIDGPRHTVNGMELPCARDITLHHYGIHTLEDRKVAMELRNCQYL